MLKVSSQVSNPRHPNTLGYESGNPNGDSNDLDSNDLGYPCNHSVSVFDRYDLEFKWLLSFGVNGCLGNVGRAVFFYHKFTCEDYDN